MVLLLFILQSVFMYHLCVIKAAECRVLDGSAKDIHVYPDISCICLNAGSSQTTITGKATTLLHP